MNPHRFCGPKFGQRVLVVAITLWLVWLFGGCLIGRDRLAFRDVSHFYLPLYGYVGERFFAEGLPLWNPLDRFGIPIAGESTTAIFYPPRLLFSCGLPADYAMTLYVVGHLVLAGAGAYWTARRSGANAIASLAAATAYPASGSVFFLYTNPPFLVGAAWLPWTVGPLLIAVGRSFSGSSSAPQTSFASVAVASIALAMAVLGGDPQTALHAVLFVAAYWMWERIRTGWSRRAAAPVPQQSPQRPRLSPLLASVLLALGLSSLQIFAGLTWSLQSWRHHTQPPNLYGWIAASLDGESPHRELATAAIPPHASGVYDYSIAPWHWCELASPMVSGRLFPKNGRLSMLIPGEPRMWTPTLYVGLLPLICLLAGPLRPKHWTVWHALVAAGLLLSLGEFGIVKTVRVGTGVLGGTFDGGLQDAVGGGYWMLVTFVPGYGQFRYPAKWLPFAALGMAVWAAVFLTRCDERDRQRLARISWGVAVIATILLIVAWLPIFHRSVAAAAAESTLRDRFWGPLDVRTGMQTLRLSLLYTGLVSGGYGLLFRGRGCWNRRSGGAEASARGLPAVQGRLGQSLAVLILVSDLALSTSWQLAAVDRPSTNRGVEHELLDSAAPHAPGPPARFLSLAAPGAWPPTWRRFGAADRMERVEAAQRETWFARWHLADSAAVVNSTVSIASARSSLFWNEARRYADRLGSDDRQAFFESLSRFLAIEAILERRISRAGNDDPDRASLVFAPVRQPLPMIRWHGEWEFGGDSNFISLGEQMRDLFAAIDRSGGDPVPQVERSGSEVLAQPSVSRGSGAVKVPHRVELVSWSPQRISLRLDADAAGLVTVQQLQDGFWKARLRRESESQWIEVPVHRVDGIAQGIVVPAGRHQVEFRYRPTWLLLGGLATAATTLVLLCGFWWQWRGPPSIILKRKLRSAESRHVAE